MKVNQNQILEMLNDSDLFVVDRGENSQSQGLQAGRDSCPDESEASSSHAHRVQARSSSDSRSL